jgi:transcription factor C subunit 6
VFNAGASVWGVDWCHIHPDDRPRKKYVRLVQRPSLTFHVEPDCSYKYYLAVAPLPSRTHSPEIGVKVLRPSRACVQLWSFGPSDDVEGSGHDRRNALRNGAVHRQRASVGAEMVSLALARFCMFPNNHFTCAAHQSMK